MNKINTLKQSVDKHFEKYPRYVDNHIWELLKCMRLKKDAQDKYEHEREGDFLRGYEAAVKTAIEFISSAPKTWPISKEWTGRMIVAMLKKMHTDEYFINSKLYEEFDKYDNIDYKPEYAKSNLFTSPHNANKVIMVIDLNYETHEYEYVEFDVCDGVCKGMSYKKMNFKEFDNMFALNEYM